MKSFFEKRRDDNTEISINRNGKALFPIHFHSNLEIFIVKNGKYQVTANDKKYIIDSNSIYIFDSYDMHGYDLKLSEESENIIFIIPFKYLSNFNEFKRGKSIENPHVTNAVLVDKLFEICEEIENSASEYKTQALVDLFLSNLCENLTFTNEKRKNDSYLIRQILEYIENNFKGDCTRDSIAQRLGYSATYISKVFNSYIKTNVSTYVNSLRLNYVENNLGKGKTVLELIYESGFKSQQTYYRFLKNNK